MPTGSGRNFDVSPSFELRVEGPRFHLKVGDDVWWLIASKKPHCGKLENFCEDGPMYQCLASRVRCQSVVRAIEEQDGPVMVDPRLIASKNTQCGKLENFARIDQMSQCRLAVKYSMIHFKAAVTAITLMIRKTERQVPIVMTEINNDRSLLSLNGKEC